VRDPRLNVVALETNPFCLAQLERNIPEDFKPRLAVIATAGSVPQMHFDLIVVDGRLPATQDWAFLQRGTVLFVEGDPEYQCSKLMRIARTKNLVCDLDKQSFGELSLGRQKTRFGFYVPIFRRRKTCRVGGDGVSQFAREAMAQGGLGNALEQRPYSRAYPRETERRPFT
jgi:hypothetical protein